MFFMLCVFLAVFSEGVTAATLIELKQADKVRIKTWIEPLENIIARQRVNLQIEIATDNRFSGGTRIGVPDVKDAIVLQREKFAVNSTRNEGGRNWAVQQWTLVVYPQRDGMFEIPDPDRPVTVFSIAPAHAADTVFAHVGGGEVVFVGDGGAQTPELRTALQELGLYFPNC